MRPCGPRADRRSAFQAVPGFCAVGKTRFRGAEAPRCQSETGAPLRRASRGSAVRGADRRSAFQAVPAILLSRRSPVRGKTNGSELCSLPTISGESVKGGSPLHKKKALMNRNSPPRAASGAPGICDSRARSSWESGPPTPTPPAPGSPCGSRRTSEARREAPGFPDGAHSPTEEGPNLTTTRGGPRPGTAQCAVQDLNLRPPACKAGALPLS